MNVYEENIANILEEEIRENRISGAQAACFLNGEKIVHKCAGYLFHDKTCYRSCSNDSQGTRNVGF